MNKVAPRLALALMAITIVLLIPHSAFAQLGPAGAPTDTNFTDLSSPDPSNQYLAMIWGTTLFPSSGGPAATVLSQLSGMLNTVILSVAACFFSWQLITGTVQTAHHGEVLGKEWSSLWVPVRFVAAGAMMIPAGPGGTILMQQIIAYMVQLGMKAGMLCALYVVSQVAAGVPASKLPAPSYDDVAENVWQMSMCMSDYNYSGVPAGKSSNGYTLDQTTASDGSTIFMVNGGSYNSVSPCGTITVTPNSNAAFAPYAQAQVQAVAALFAGFQPMTDEIAQAIHPDVGDFPPLPTPAQIAQLIVAAQTTVAGASANFANDMQTGNNTGPMGSQQPTNTISGMVTSQMYSNFTSCGWVCVGAYYNTLAEANAAVSNAANAKPTYTAANSGEIPMPDDTAADFRGADALANQLWSRRNSTNPNDLSWTPGPSPYGQYVAAQEKAKSEGLFDKVSSAWNKVTSAKLSDILVPAIASSMSGITSVLSGGWVSNLGPSVTNPLSSLTMLGEVVVSAAVSATTAITLALSGVGAIPGIGETAVAFENGPAGHILNFILEAMVGTGSFLAYVLPMMPYIIWIFSVIGYFTLVTEALIAAPFWAFAHLKAGGHGVHGEAGAGYMIVFNILMRPALMVAGLVAGMAIFSVGVDVLTNTFSTAAADTFSGQNLIAGGGIGSATATVLNTAAMKGIGISGVFVLLLGFLIKFIMFTVLVVVMGERSFALIHKLPDTVVRWFGGHAEDLGESEGSHGARGLIISGANKAHTLDDAGKAGAAKQATVNAEKEKEMERIRGLQQTGSVSKAMPQGRSGTSKDSREI